MLALPLAEEGLRILVTGIHHLYFPTQVALLNAGGVIEREFWHSGHIHRLVRHMLAGKEVVLAGGTSNRSHEAAGFVIDPDSLEGVSEESSQDYQLVGELSRGVRRILFPRSCINRSFNPMNSIGHIYASPHGVTITTIERALGPDLPQVQYHFSAEMVFRGTSASSNFQAEHERLAQTGQLDHHLHPHELEKLRPH